ncbi:hypothetical protein IAR55_000245 [Kwoniella newhampshirensis]|uniref:Major facilitator superfamily (MFS) profile domain-containing protein n=1 Tax=Kwoniella newhampshirensis TaxID=1651941 RepID=A0AAW0Z658_9TREE
MSPKSTTAKTPEVSTWDLPVPQADVDDRPRLEQMQVQTDEEASNEPSHSALPRVDGGWGAWTYLAAATGLETLIWGFANSYGVFLDHYDTLYPSSTSLLPIVGTISVGAMYLLLSPLTLYLTSHPRQRKPVMWIGLVVMFAGFIGAAFANSAGTLILTQGVLYSIGGTMLYCPTTNYMFEWWFNRRGLATGIMFAGTGAGGLVMPLISSALLQKYGKRTTLLAIGISYAILLGSLVPFIRPRLPPTPPSATRSPKLDWSFLRHLPFWLLWCGVLFQGLAAFMPCTYLPSYATALSLSPTIGTLSVALMNLARVPGQVIFGHLSDKLGPRRLILAMAAVSATTVFGGWGAATNTGGVIGFSLAFGACAGSYTAQFPRFISIITQDDPHLPAILWALFSLARGLGSIASGPLSSALISTDSMGGAKGGYGVGGFGVLIIWTGAALVMSGVAAGYKGFKVD